LRIVPHVSHGALEHRLMHACAAWRRASAFSWPRWPRRVSRFSSQACPTWMRAHWRGQGLRRSGAKIVTRSSSDQGGGRSPGTAHPTSRVRETPGGRSSPFTRMTSL
jgi:hypothetical protein